MRNTNKSIFIYSFSNYCDHLTEMTGVNNIFAGIALTLLQIPGQALQAKYFYKYYPLALGVLASCGAVGIIVFPL